MRQLIHLIYDEMLKSLFYSLLTTEIINHSVMMGEKSATARNDIISSAMTSSAPGVTTSGHVAGGAPGGDSLFNAANLLGKFY